MADRSLADSLPDIVYLAGMGRSGTTILEVLLANGVQWIGVGEVTHIFQDGFKRNMPCSCGASARDCAFWSEVRRRCGWTAETDDRHHALFRQYAWHSRFPVVALGLDSHAARAEFLDLNYHLFSAAKCASDADVVVDSSKYAARALALARMFPDRVRIICVTRSPVGLINAFRREDAGEQRPKTLFATFLYYVYVVSCLRFVMWRVGARAMHIRYEEFTSTPIVALERISRFVGRELSLPMKKLAGDEELQVGHIVTGNRLRMNGKVRFRKSVTEGRLARKRERIVAWLMGLYFRVLGF